MNLLSPDDIKRAADLAAKHARERAELAGRQENERRELAARQEAETRAFSRPAQPADKTKSKKP